MNAIFDRRTFLALSLTLLTGTARAASRDADDPAIADPRFHQATDMLVRGVRFERSAEILRGVATDFPESSKTRLALACALVSRIAALSYAARFAEALKAEHISFPERLRQWQVEQKDPQNTEKDTQPRPLVSPDIEILIKDDKTPYRLTHDGLIVKVGALRSEALAQFEALAKVVRQPEEQAEIAYYHGWCLRLLAEYGQTIDMDALMDTGEETPSPALFPIPEKKEITICFQEATTTAPENATYWRALGDILGNVTEASDAYRKSLELDARQPLLWYKLYTDEMTKSVPDATEDEDDPSTPRKPRRIFSIRDAEFYLEKAAWADPSNSFYLYEQANLSLKETHFDAYFNSTTRKDEVEALRPVTVRNKATTAISKTERANNAKNLTFPFYREVSPRWLAMAWDYVTWLKLAAPWYARLRELARSLSGLAIFMASEFRDMETANRACRAAIGLGRRFIGDATVPPHGDKNFSVLTRLVGIAIVAIAYKSWISATQLGGSGEQVQTIQQEEAAFRTWVTDYRKTLQETVRTEHYTTFY